jgi:hypothetical protein
VRTSKLLISSILSLGLLAAILGGCSESKNRAAARKLASQGDIARRLCERAMTLISDTPFLVNGTHTPLAGATGANFTKESITLLPAGSVNPRAMEALTEAQKVLSDAINEVKADASPADLAAAQQTMARVFDLKSAYLAQQAAAQRAAVDSSLASAGDAAALLAALKGLGQYYEKLLAMSDKELQAEKADVANRSKIAAQEAAKSAADVKKAEGELRDLLNEREACAADIQRMNREAQDLAADAALHLNEKIDTVRERANTLTAQALTAETHLNTARQSQRDVQLLSQSLKMRSDAIAMVADGRSKHVDITTRTREAWGKAVADQVKVVSDALAAAAADVRKFVSASADARKECNDALQQLQASAAADAAWTKTLVPASRAAAHYRMGQLWLNEGRLLSRVATLVAQAEAAMPKDAQIAAFEELKNVAAEHAKTAARCIEDFDQAVRQFEVAYSAADKSQKWSYQGNLAMVFASKAQVLEGDARTKALQSASEAKDAAIAGRPDSIYAAELQRAIDAASGLKAPPAGAPSGPAGS